MKERINRIISRPAAWLSLFASSAAAQTAGTPAESVELQPPQLLESVEAAYPEQARVAGFEGTVLLRLSIDADGRVTEAEVTQPAGNGFDEAARDAVLQFRFQPAKRNGESIAARILFPYEFRLPPESAREPGPAPGDDDDAGVALPPEPVIVAPPPLQPSAASPAQPVEVTVAGARNEAEQLRQSAEAVTVIDTYRAKQQTADLGEVLARTQGVAIRRSGGLGSNTRFSLNGLYGDQIRFFLDDIPLDLAGYPFGVVDVPPNLVDGVEVYRGVVPIRLGADALGGAVNLVSDTSYETHAAASYQLGSFGTHRVTLDGRYRDESAGVVVGASAFFDLTDNDYDVDVEIPDARGRLHDATVPRFHDGYRAYGGMIEGGVVDRPWAKRLLLRGFMSTYEKELQHNTVMTVPYGEVEYGETVYGATARYEVDLAPQFELDVVGSYTQRIIDYSDQSQWVYSWTGERVRERRVAGETDVRPHDQTVWQDSAFGRALASWTITSQQTLRASLTPSFTTRSGDERLQADPKARDPLTAQRDLFTFVSGIEYQLDLFGDRLSNIAFVKDYYYDANSEEPLAGKTFKKRDTERHRFGVGDSLRFRFTRWLYAKASYEYATRLPRPHEVFGDAILIHENLELEPEVSHNLNLGPRVEYEAKGFGALTFEVNGFLRATDRLIVLLGNDRFFTYQNVYRARGLGVENALNWESPGRYLTLDGMLTWQDVRNTSDEGTFGDFEGDRIPNRPYVFGSWGARLRFGSLPSARDVLEPFYIGRYVHGFFRGWESQGLREFKQTVDAQVTHSAGISWTLARSYGRLTTTFEVDNLTDAKVFDNFGVQRPGRALYLKLTGEM
jgi:vitamin B12 transporter